MYLACTIHYKPLPKNSNVVMYVTYAVVHVKKCIHLSYVMFQHSHSLVQPQVMMSFVLQNGWIPLHSASHNGRLDVVKTLIEAGTNVSLANKVQCVGRLHVSFSVFVIYEHTYILCMTAQPVCTVCLLTLKANICKLTCIR